MFRLHLKPELDHILLEPDHPLPLLHRTLHRKSPTGTGLILLELDRGTRPWDQCVSHWSRTNRTVEPDSFVVALNQPVRSTRLCYWDWINWPTGPTGPGNLPCCPPASCWKLVLESSRRSCGPIAKQIFVEKLWKKKKLKVKRLWMHLMRSKQQEQQLPCPMIGFEPRSS